MTGSVIAEEVDGIFRITLNRPDVLNALDAATVDELSLAWEKAAQPSVRAVILTGSGKGFCAGADITSARTESSRPMGLRHSYNPMILQMSAVRAPIIAAVNGAAAGAGLSLACAADIIIASDRARFVPSFVSIGLIPDAGGTYFIPRLLGKARAFEWLSSGRKIEAGEALSIGLVSEVAPAESLLDRASARADALAGMPGLGVSLTKSAINGDMRRELAAQLETEDALQREAFQAPGRAEARAEMVKKLRNENAEGAR